MKTRLKTYRKMGEPTISQEELALHIGTSRETISRIENGKHEPRLETAIRIAAVLSDLLGQPVHVEDIWNL